MRRRRIWIGVVATASLLALLVVTLAIWPARAPFQFLEGREPAPQSPLVEKDMASLNISLASYSFRAEFKTVAEAARRELLGKGYKEGPIMPPVARYQQVSFSRGAESGVVGPSGIRYDARPSVTLIKDARLLGAPSFGVTGEKGWVVVIETGSQQRSLFEQFTDWLGL